MKIRTLFVLIIVAFMISFLCSCSNEPQIHEHTFSEEWSHDETYHWHSSTCGHDIVSDKAKHAWDNGTITKAPTHLEDGIKTFTCSGCGATRTETIPASSDAHTFSEEWSHDETYHWHASTCGHDVVSDKAEHSWDNGIITKAPTHLEDGIKTFTCSGCGATRTETIPAASDAHSFSEEWSHDETYHWHASTCGHDVVSDKAEHAWDNGIVTKAPTHLEDGIRTFTCSECEKTKAEIIPHYEFELFFAVNNGVLTVINKTGLPSHIIIPESINGEKITSIGYNAFSGCTGLSEITIPDSVTSIGNYAFDGWTNEQTIIINYGGFSANSYTWSGCSAKIEVTIPDSVTSIGNYAFCGCTGLTEFTIPDSVTSIGDYAFYGWINEQTIKINYGGFSANSNTWCGCSARIDVTIPDSVTSIGNYAFRGCSGLTEITIIPDSVTSIGNYAFCGCTGLTEITIPDSVTSIGNNAFDWCSGLTEITIPDSVTSIGDYAFQGWTNEQTIIINYGGFYANSYTWFGCSAKIEITIPDSVTSIGNYAFCGCTGLTEFTIPDSVTSIGNNAFYWCSGLTEITIHDSVTSIGNSAFSGCTGLTEITIPDSVTSIGNYAFQGWTNEQTIRYIYGIFPANSYTWSGCSAKLEIIIPDGTTSIGDSFFRNNTKIVRITIPDSVTSIGNNAFYGCTGLTEITIPDSVTSIGNNAFYGCTGLTELTIPASVSSIGTYAFYSCSNIGTISYSGTVSQWESIGKGKAYATNIGTSVIHCSDGDCPLP